MHLVIEVLKHFIDNFVVVFVDDILVFSGSKEDLLRHVDMVPRRLHE